MLEILAKLQEMGITVQTANFQTGEVSIVIPAKSAKKENVPDENTLDVLYTRLAGEIWRQVNEEEKGNREHFSIIPLIKIHREIMNSSLSEAKKYVEEFISDRRFGCKTDKGMWLFHY